MTTTYCRHLILAAFAVLAGSADANLDSSGRSVNFFYDPTEGGDLICNGDAKPKPSGGPTNCEFDDQGMLQVSRTSWSGKTAVLNEAGAITGPCRDSLIPGAIDNYNLTPNCVPNDGGERRDATGERLVDEWFTDLPWHQKLSTLHSNLIDIPFVLPFAAIPTNLCSANATPTEKARCMLRYGIVNVMAMHRTDTLYLADEAPDGQDCRDGTCVEMKFIFQRLHTQTTDPSGYEADIVMNDGYDKNRLAIPSLGFAITESTIFAPWRSWYMGHYCAVDQDNITDSVCYEDYFTTQLLAATNIAANQVWLRDRPSLFFPQKPGDGQFGTFCATGSDACPMLLGKVGFLPEATEPRILACKGDPPETCRAEVLSKTANLDRQFNFSLSEFADNGRYPWNEGVQLDLGGAVKTNPFIGFYELSKYADAGEGGPSLFQAAGYVLPKRCSTEDFLNARQHGNPDEFALALKHLDDCATNFEVHTNGFFENWKALYGGSLDDAAVLEIRKVFPNLGDNQYGRTMFMYAGLAEQKIPVSFVADELDGLSLHDKIYGSSLYTQYLPMVNPADLTQRSKYYQNDFWHAFFMSNNMNQTPDHFIRGIRGRTLWHNEYRSNLMYKAAVERTDIGTRFEGHLKHVDFPAGFQTVNHRSPFHGNTCDSCHIRNGSGIPLMPNRQLPQIHVDRGMKQDFALDPPDLDYTYTSRNLPSMKMVLFDLKDVAERLETCDADDHTTPKALDYPGGERYKRFYKNKIMNFYGNSFHVNQSDGFPTYELAHVTIEPGSGFEIVDQTPRLRPDDPSADYLPKRVSISAIDTGTSRCTEITERPRWIAPGNWPNSCADVSGTEILQAIEDGEIGFMHLLGKRLGNSPLIEMIPDRVILETQRMQSDRNTGITQAGCYGLAAGTRTGPDGESNYRSCRTQRLGNTPDDCYISRWGWIGDRVSLEDQVANAAHVEQNITSKEGFERLHPNATGSVQLVRYPHTLCGPADLGCQNSEANSDITEQEIRDMATYQRWIGIPQRSEYQVSSAKVQRGELIFRDLGCSSCHVIDKIPFVEQDNMLPDEQRIALKALRIESGGAPDYPFVSYLGTDLLMHDMGYLSQVAKAPNRTGLRNANGTVKPGYNSFIQPIRTPPLKGLRFNRFVTDSNHNTTRPISKGTPADEIVPGCDFLLHDGRACDAVEAAYLHDGPAVKALGMIERLNGLSVDQIRDLRAFLYSL